MKGENTLKQLATGRGMFRVTDAGLGHLKDFKKLTFLDLQNSEVTARGLEQLKGMSSLTQLWLSGTSITESEVDAVSPGDAGGEGEQIGDLSGLPSLEWLRVEDNGITDAGSAHRMNYPSLRR